jgi:hypothetical protein
MRLLPLCRAVGSISRAAAEAVPSGVYGFSVAAPSVLTAPA